METSIRFVRIDRMPVKPALCFRGRKQAYAIINDQTVIRVVSNIPLSQIDKSHIVLGPIGVGTRDYPVSLFAERFLKIGQQKGMTKRAEYMLRRALEGGIEDNESLPPDELPGEARIVELKTSLPENPLPEPARERIARAAAGKSCRDCGAAQGEPHGSRCTHPSTTEKPATRSSGASASGSERTAGADVIRRIAAELKLEPTKLRKLLRSKGLSAPYTDEKLIRSKL